MTIPLAQEELNGIHAPLTLEFGSPPSQACEPNNSRSGFAINSIGFAVS